MIITGRFIFSKLALSAKIRAPYIAVTSKFAIKVECFIIQDMKVQALHEWEVSIARAKEIQLSLAKKVVAESEVIDPSLVAGIDIAAPDAQGIARGAIVILRYPELSIVEVEIAQGKLTLPYIPGLLSFRETPLILAACVKLNNIPDLILIDGQGIAHPRRLGLASHVGLFLDLPTIGCAKSILCGQHQPLGEDTGSHAGLLDNGELIGAALRTKSGVRPIYVSVGHKIGLTSALQLVMKCCRGYRLPEPTRLAHLAAGGMLTSESSCQGNSFDLGVL